MDKQNRAARKKYHIIYKTTCTVTGRYYIGMHSTDKLDDGYLGSGKRLWRSLKKHGRDAHIYEILEHLPSREALRLREAEIVNEKLIGDDQCMNLALGGHGDWSHCNSTGANCYPKKGNPNVLAAIKKAGARSAEVLLDPIIKQRWAEQISVTSKQRYIDGFVNPFQGKQHSTETLAKIKASFDAIGHQRGEKNSSFGSQWITNGEINKKQAKTLPIPDGWRRGRIIGS